VELLSGSNFEGKVGTRRISKTYLLASSATPGSPLNGNVSGVAQLESPFTCSECGGRIVVAPSGERVCSSCGLVYPQDNLEFLEYVERYHGDVDPESFLPMSVRGQNPLGTLIGLPGKFFFTDASGRKLNPRLQALFRRLKVLHEYSPGLAKLEGRRRALRLLRKVVEILKLPPEICQDALKIYDQLLGIMPSTNYVILTATSLLLACRIKGSKAPVTLQEIAEALQVLGHRVAPRTIVKMAAFAVSHGKISAPNMRRSEDYIDKMVKQLAEAPMLLLRMSKAGVKSRGYLDELKKIALQLLAKTPERAKSGKNPYTLAASAIYAADRVLAQRENREPVITQALLSKTLKIAEYTVREHWVKIFSHTASELVEDL